MTDQIPDLWPPDFGTKKLTPVAILREQGELLARRTQGVLRGLVRTISTEGPTAGTAGFLHTFFVLAPTLDDYAYELFQVHHGIPVYPARVCVAILETDIVANSEAEFIRTLRGVFTAEQTKDLINTLLSQAQPVAG